MKTQFDHHSQTYSLDLTPSGKNYRVMLNDKHIAVEILRAADGQLDLLLDGKAFSATVSSDGANRWVTVGGQTFVLTKSAGGAKQGSHGGHSKDELLAPMPGLVRAVQVEEGQAVTKGQTLVIIEAMKMEIKIAAPREGVVKILKVKQGQTVEKDQILVEMGSRK